MLNWLARSAPLRVFAKCFMKVCLWACYKFTSQVEGERGRGGGTNSAHLTLKRLRGELTESKVHCGKLCEFPAQRRTLLLSPEIRFKLRQSRDVLCDQSCLISYFLLVFSSNYPTRGFRSGDFRAASVPARVLQCEALWCDVECSETLKNPTNHLYHWTSGWSPLSFNKLSFMSSFGGK